MQPGHGSGANPPPDASTAPASTNANATHTRRSTVNTRAASVFMRPA